MASKPRSLQLSIIIVNYNVRDFLHHALISLRKATKGIRSEIVVVDNASDDGSTEMLRRRFPNVTLIASKQNLGFARANNLALKRARGAFLLLINPDTVVQEDTLRAMLEFFKNTPEAGLAGCKILNPDGTFQLACRRSFPTPWVAFTKIFGLSKLFPRSSWFGKYNLTYLSPEETYEVDAVSGSFMMLRKEVFEKVGGLDEEFFMYGEDIDWCYRIQQSGWKIYYAPLTQIIHYKGESTRRSSLDEIQTFYDAMHRFVKKHFGRSSFLRIVLRAGIMLTLLGALVKSLLNPVRLAVVDFLLVDISLVIAEYFRRGEVFMYPAYAYPIVYVVPATIVVASLYIAGVYTNRPMSISRSSVAVMASYVVIASLTALFTEYAFSRIIMGISGILSVFLIPGWRTMLKLFGRVQTTERKGLLSKRTLIVGTDAAAIELCKKLRTKVGEGYHVIGFVDRTRRRVGEKIESVPVLGSIENVGKVIREHRASDVIFSTKELSYMSILSVLSRIRRQSVNFHLVPNTLEVMIGKASVDALDDLPLVQLSYNLEKPLHRITKRLFDLGISALLFTFVYPILRLKSALTNEQPSPPIRSLPAVLRGNMSFVGPPKDLRALRNGHTDPVNLGKPGITGLVQLQGERPMSPEEVDQYNLYYARNQSVLLDMEILIKTMLQRRKN
ncbi:MAG: glycosyltransferase [Bacteroidota bacterium]